MKRNQLNRIESLKASFIPKFTVLGIDEPWGELDESYQFYLEHSPAATGCTWQEYFNKQKDAGFYPQSMTYQEFMEDAGQW